MAILTPQQQRDFDRDGFLLVEDAVDTVQLAALRRDFAGWV